MRRLLLLPALLCTAVLATAVPDLAPEPPLPGENEPGKPREAFELLPRIKDPPTDNTLPPDDLVPPDDLLPPAGDDPILPPPEGDALEVFQDMDPPGAPSDGEPMPEMPHVPGLVLPKFRPQSGPRDGVPSLPGLDPAGDLLPAPSVALAPHAKWLSSPYQARRLAHEQGKPLLIFFAQIIDGPCPTLLLNVDLLALPEFNEFAAARLVLTHLQYPTGSPGKEYTEEKLAVLKLVKDKFKIRGFPALIMLDDQGHEIERITGYSQMEDRSTGTKYSTAHTLLERLKEAEHRHSDRRRYKQERLDRLTEQGYRTWTSTAGSSLLAKMVRAAPQQITLMDENNAWRVVRPDQLKLYDAEWARRKQAGLLPDAAAKKVTVATDAAPAPRGAEPVPQGAGIPGGFSNAAGP